MRIILDAIERQEKWDLLNNIIANTFRLRLSENDWLKDLKRATMLLNEFKEFIWNDPIETEIEKRRSISIQNEYLLSIEQTKIRNDKIWILKTKLIDIQKNLWTQQAWYDFERLFFDLLELEWFEYAPPYRVGHEQIDGSMKYNKFDYLIEIKATRDLVWQNEFSIFDWKIRWKWQSTRGFFLSLTGFQESWLLKYTWDSPRIMCMDWFELYQCLDGIYDLVDVLKNKEDAFVRKWEIFAKI